MTSKEFSLWLRGALRSMTVWLGLVIATMPDWAPLVSGEVRDLVSTYPWGDIVMRVFGILVILLRFRTQYSLPQKAMMADMRAGGDVPSQRAEDASHPSRRNLP